MEYEKPSIVTASPRKLPCRSHSLNFSGNVVYDGVFASPPNYNKPAPLLDYGEIFRGSGPSSSIPFLNVPELSEEKITVDTRSTELDYSSVFGGFEVCEFTVSPEERIFKSMKNNDGKEERNAGKAGKYYGRHSSKAMNQISSPEAINMKKFNMSCHQTNPTVENGINGISQIAKVHAPSGYAKVVDDTCLSQKMESRTHISSAKVELCNEGPMEDTKPVPSVKMEACNGSPTEVTDSSKAKVDISHSNASSKCSSKTEGEFQNILGRNECNAGYNLADNACEIDCNVNQPDMTAPSSLLRSSDHNNKDAYERRMGSKSRVLETFDAPCSPPYFDEETHANSGAAMSAAAVKKAIEEAQLRIKIAKQMMRRKKEGFCSHAKSRSSDGLKAEDEANRNGERQTDKHRDDETQYFGEVVNSSRQTFPKGGDHLVKRARKQWAVPGELLKSTLEHKQEEVEKHEAIKLGEEHARRARKQWEIPGGISESVLNGKQGDTDNLAAAKLETHTNREMLQVAENSFYTLGQLGNKKKSVVEAFTGNKVEQKNEAEGPECGVKVFQDNVKLSHEDSIQEEQKKVRIVEPQEMLVIPSDAKTSEREVEEILKSTEDKSKTQIDKNAEPDMCILTEECSQKEEKEMGLCVQSENASESGNEPGGNVKESNTPRRRRFWKTSEDVYKMIRFPKGYRMPCLLEDNEEMVKRCLGEDSVRVDDISKSEETDDTSEPSDSGIQENPNILKQMFRQTYQAVESRREDKTCRLVEYEQMQTENNQRLKAEDRKRIADSLIYRLTGTDKCINAYNNKQVESDAFSLEFQAHVHTRGSVDPKLTLEGRHPVEHGIIMEQTKESLVSDLTRKEAGNREVLEASEAAGSSCLSTSETDSSDSDEKFEQKPLEELTEETRVDHNIENEEGELSFELRQGYSGTDEVEHGQKLSDQSHEKTNTASSTEELVEEVDSESNKSGWDVDGMELIIEQQVHEDDFEYLLEENLADYVEGAEATQLPCEREGEETREESDEMKTSQSAKRNEDEHNVECPPETEFLNRKDAEAAELPIDETDAASVTDMKKIDGEEPCRSLAGEKREVTEGASRREAEPVEEHPKKKDEANKSKTKREKDRLMVERAIREARERAFAEARERAERAAMEKANTEAYRRPTTKTPVKSDRPFLEVNDKSPSTEKASTQAKLRAERAAVERALTEARQRALEKALSGKSASQAKTQGSKPSAFASSGTHSRSSSSSKNYAYTNFSNQSTNGEPVQRCRARSERNQRTVERAAKALAEKKLRDIIAQKEQAERNRFSETLDAEVNRWSNGKEGNLRALLSTLQYILGPESGWKPVPLTELVSSAAVRKAYRKATLYVHPDKLQQRGAGTQQKYTCEKVFDLLKEAWNKFSRDER